MYEKIFQHILNPFFEKVIKKRKALDYRKFLEGSQWWTEDQLRRYQWGELQKLLEHAYNQVPFWKSALDEMHLKISDIQTPENFRKLPIIDKSDIRQNKNEMIARNYIGKTWTKATGGSTGIPLELDYTPDSYDWRVAISRRGYGWAGCEDGMNQAWIWGVDLGEKTPIRKFKESLHKRLLGHRIYNCFVFDEENMEKCLKELNRTKPKVIVGYTNPLYNFSNFVKEHGGLSYKPQSIITAAEKLEEFQREAMEKNFQAPVFNTYGSREFMLIAAEDENHDGLLMSNENLYIEIIKENGEPAKSGEMGDIIITDLHNWGMPFIRYRIGDMAVPSDKKPRSGRGLPMLEKIVGRTLDILKTKDGKKVPGEFFPHLMKDFKGVEQFQVVQDSLEQLNLNIIKNDQLSDEHIELMNQEIKKVMGEFIDVEINFVKSIALTKTGKFRVTICNLKD